MLFKILRPRYVREAAVVLTKCVVLDAQAKALGVALGLIQTAREFPRRLCDPLPQYDFIVSAVVPL